MILRRRYQIDFDEGDIGIGLNLPHAANITFVSGITIGKNCSIFQDVLFGRKHSGNEKINMRIGNNVKIYAKATIL
jgi:serine acetyltransferase